MPNFASWTTGQVAVFAAIVGFVGALTAAIVKAVADWMLDKSKAKREYRLRTLQPALDYVADRVRGLERFEGVLGRVSDEDDDDEHDAMRDATANFRGLTTVGMIETDPALRDAWSAFIHSKRQCEFLIGRADRVAHGAEMAAVREQFEIAVNDARESALVFRKAVEDFVF